MRAHEEDWIKDEQRLLYFAVSRLRKKALRWYATLDSADRSDWGRFIQALFAKYPETDDTIASSDLRHFSSAGTTVMNDSALEQQGNLLPITSDSPHLGSRVPEIENNLHDSWFTSPQVLSLQSSGMGALFIGKLRLVLGAENDFPRYIWGGTSQDGTEPGSTVDFKKTTMYIDSALIVSFKRYDEPYSICCVDPELGQRDLGIRLNQNSKHHAIIALNGVIPVDAASETSPDVSRVWNILEDSTLQATIVDVSGSNQEIITSTTIHVDLSGDSISFVKDDTELPDGQPQSGRPMLSG
ncbi:hypothetical protein FRC04_010855 [Tulasnella sp. 424]|nr:hypothetical protein FRC04_010855 [Tulasnella sp. 424]